MQVTGLTPQALDSVSRPLVLAGLPCQQAETNCLPLRRKPRLPDGPREEARDKSRRNDYANPRQSRQRREDSTQPNGTEHGEKPEQQHAIAAPLRPLLVQPRGAQQGVAL